MSEISLEDLLGKRAGDFKPPPLIPQGPYRFRTEGLEFGTSREKKTPFAKVHFAPLEAMDGVDASQLENIELEKRKMSYDFYLTDDASYRLVEFAKMCGVEDVASISLKEVCGRLKNNKYQIVGYVIHVPNKNARAESDPKYYANIDRFSSL